MLMLRQQRQLIAACAVELAGTVGFVIADGDNTRHSSAIHQQRYHASTIPHMQVVNLNEKASNKLQVGTIPSTNDLTATEMLLVFAPAKQHDV